MALRNMIWTDEQAGAITETGDVLLEASAGTGKTTTVVGKILWALGLEAGSTGNPPESLTRAPRPCRLDQVAAITFTEKAAYDLKRKLRTEIEAAEGGDRLRWELDRASVGTIHGFCAELLREHSLRLGIDPTFRILDERETRIEQDEIIRAELKRALAAGETEARALLTRFGRLYDGTHQQGAIGNVRTALRDIRWHAGRYEDWLERPAGADPSIAEERVLSLLGAESGQPVEAEHEQGDREALRIAACLHRYAYRSLRRWLAWLEAENVRDFDSLILDARRLLTRPGTRPALEAVRSQYRILIIDEFQDTDAAQRDIAFAIAGLPVPGSGGPGPSGPEAVPAEARPQLFLVGDPKQSIYRFRGADIGVWNEVRDTLETRGSLLSLSHNFRSEPQVVEYVNRVCAAVMAERAESLAQLAPRSAVPYAQLRSALPSTRAAGIEWLVNERSGADTRDAEGRLVASRIRALVGREPVRDPESGLLRPARYGDVAILSRTRDGVRGIEPALRQYGVPYYNSSAGDLADRQEILDLVTVLRLADDPHDDLRAFAFLRSPFVGLRDEVLTRIRLDPAVRARARADGSYLEQARVFLELSEAGELEPFEAPECPLVHAIELEALGDGLRAIEEAHGLVDRVDHAGILEQVLQTTGYRLHLLLRSPSTVALANIERFQALLDDYRHLPLGGFLRLWDRWGDQDTGIPQASLVSRDDDVVTLSTIHTAKGLEWPIVILVGTRGGPDTGGRLSGTFWSDPALGPVLMPSRGDRGPRSDRLFAVALAEDHAEEARLLYVAATRARDRLLVSGPTEENRGYAGWLRGIGREGAIEAHEAATLRPNTDGGTPARPRRTSRRAESPDSTTGTGRQLDAFGLDDDPADGDGQLSLFAHRDSSSLEGGTDAPGAGPTTVGLPMVIHRSPAPIQQSLAQLPVHLSWLAAIEPSDPPAITLPIPDPVRSSATSATELLVRERDAAEWELRYRHAVIPEATFAPAEAADGLPAHLRGTVIHGVLEKIEQEAELASLLEEAIAGLDAPQSETLLEPGSAYRRALEAEIAAVIRSPEWSWYVDAPNWRELPFVHLRGPREWRVGALDLLRSPEPGASGRDAHPWVVDFKTHGIAAREVPAVAARYRVQALVYRQAVASVLGFSDESEARVLLHFTRPNVAVEP